jgi:hypothetical protein
MPLQGHVLLGATEIKQFKSMILMHLFLSSKLMRISQDVTKLSYTLGKVPHVALCVIE